MLWNDDSSSACQRHVFQDPPAITHHVSIACLCPMHQANMFIQSALLRFTSDPAEQTNEEELDEQATPKGKDKGIQQNALPS